MNPDILRALRRLQQSTTAITRRRARAAFRSACRSVLKDYPVICQETGCAKLDPRLPKCPLCGIPMSSWQSLTTHLRKKHRCRRGGTDGACPGCTLIYSNPGNLSRHLSALHRSGKLLAHVIDAATNAAMIQGGN